MGWLGVGRRVLPANALRTQKVIPGQSSGRLAGIALSTAPSGLGPFSFITICAVPFSCVGWPGERAFIPKGPSEELTGLLELGCPGAGMTSLSAPPPLVRLR